MHVIMELVLYTGVQSCRNRKGPSSNYCPNLESIQLSKMFLYAVALILAFTGAKETRPNPENQPQIIHYPSSTKLYRCVSLPSIKPRYIHQTALGPVHKLH